VHRWHHALEVPEGHRYSVNYGVEFSFWDRMFGTFHLPLKDGIPEQPERIGHPSGQADEPNYIRLLLAPFGLYRPLLAKRAV
jgi:sterol desaturase/sphingolipid hydroxylase (fatty acid hydroxylase superfamily)